MEGDGDEERELGKEELIETINELKSYDEQVDELKSWLKDYILQWFKYKCIYKYTNLLYIFLLIRNFQIVEQVNK